MFLSDAACVAAGRLPMRQEELEQMVCAKCFLWVDGFKFLFFALHPSAP